MEKLVESIKNGDISLGIELGSTRIKAVLIDNSFKPIASGDYGWENSLINGIWTYPLEKVWEGIQSAYSMLKADVKNKYGVELRKIGSIGFSAMMHGYLAFDSDDNLLVPFRTWRNTITEEAATKLTELFSFNIPQRWSIAHLYQAILNGEDHVKNISYITTLAGYVHYSLTGNKVLGVGEASGMFPIGDNGKFNGDMLAKFEDTIKIKGYPWNINEVLPQVLSAGENAGVLTEDGAKLIDPTGDLEAGIPLCPPEGDAGTGMVATNSVLPKTGNVSAGTSIFAMIVLENQLSKVYTEIDMVTTPDGKPVAMVHCNTCTSDLDAWVKLFSQVLELSGKKVNKGELYDMLYQIALEGDSDCGGLVSYNYYSGEPVTGLEEGRPLFARMPDANFNLANFMRAQIFSTMATLKIGMDILFGQENVQLDKLLGHGGLFKTPVVGQRLMAAAMNVTTAVMETAGEGGAWGMAILASYIKDKTEETLPEYLENKVFGDNKGTSIEPNQDDVKGFNSFIESYKKGLAAEKAAVENLK